MNYVGAGDCQSSVPGVVVGVEVLAKKAICQGVVIFQEALGHYFGGGVYVDEFHSEVVAHDGDGDAAVVVV